MLYDDSMPVYQICNDFLYSLYEMNFSTSLLISTKSCSQQKAGSDVRHYNKFKAERIMMLVTAAHKDPFDRLLAAQALVEDLPVISNDARLDGYGVTRHW